MWYVADGDVKWQQSALMVSRVPFLRNPEKEKDILSEECLKALFLAPGSSKRGIRDATIMIMLYDSAIRISELLCLKLSDVHLQKDSPYLRIQGKGDKERIVSVSDNTVGHLGRYMQLYHGMDAPRTDYLFYSVIHGQPHMFRRTRATNLYQNNVELELVSRILGHASTQTTRIYAKPSLEMLKDAMDKSNPELNAEEPLWPDDEDELAKICGLR